GSGLLRRYRFLRVAASSNSMNNPLGALAPYKSNGGQHAEVEAMYRIVVTYWSAVKAAFPEAWGKDPRHSRLMHSAGLVAMGLLMDRIYARLSVEDDVAAVRRELEKIASVCRWTEGNWGSLGVAWNEIQNTPQDIKKLQDVLVRAYTMSTKR
ncbi:MAG TPA: hypothetical protein PLN31_14505, partial [Azoarcus taiwanensis]|nr:hypothetical protein [Azoarcus taiwanensis]